MKASPLFICTLLVAGCAGANNYEPIDEPASAQSRSQVLAQRALDKKNSPTTANEKKPLAWKVRLQKALNSKCTSSYEDMPPRDIIKALQKIHSVTFVATEDVDLDSPIDLPLNNLTLAQGLEIMLHKLDPDGGIVYTLNNGAIYIDDEARIGRNDESKLHFYDCRDLIGEIKDFRGPELDLGSGNELGQIAIEESSSETDEPITGDDLVELIQETISCGDWDEDNGRSISIRNGAIVVNHSPEVHESIQELLNFMRQQRALQVRTEVTFWKVTKKEWLTLRDFNPEGEIILNGKQIDYLDHLRRAREVVYDRVQCLGFNTQRMAGGSVDESILDQSDEEDDGIVARVGTILDVRPTASFDRKSITSALRITRARVTVGELDKPKLKQQFFRGQVSLPNSGMAIVSSGQEENHVMLIIVAQELHEGKQN